jgi:hypothetical protein
MDKTKMPRTNSRGIFYGINLSRSWITIIEKGRQKYTGTANRRSECCTTIGVGTQPL